LLDRFRHSRGSKPFAGPLSRVLPEAAGLGRIL
jgi:hypothetical protein